MILDCHFEASLVTPLASIYTVHFSIQWIPGRIIGVGTHRRNYASFHLHLMAALQDEECKWRWASFASLFTFRVIVCPSYSLFIAQSCKHPFIMIPLKGLISVYAQSILVQTNQYAQSKIQMHYSPKFPTSSWTALQRPQILYQSEHTIAQNI